MTDQEIKQNALDYGDCSKEWFDDKSYVGESTAYDDAHAFYDGAHSRDVEIEELKLENKYLKESLCTRKAENEDKEYLWRRDKELLNNAVSLLKDIYEDDDYFCERLLDNPEEEKICVECCDNLNEKCILRYLKHYKKDIVL